LRKEKALASLGLDPSTYFAGETAETRQPDAIEVYHIAENINRNKETIVLVNGGRFLVSAKEIHEYMGEDYFSLENVERALALILTLPRKSIGARVYFDLSSIGVDFESQASAQFMLDVLSETGLAAALAATCTSTTSTTEENA
jgi:hypothetical protein